jgi:hypothetical protein
LLYHAVNVETDSCLGLDDKLDKQPQNNGLRLMGLELKRKPVETLNSQNAKRTFGVGCDRDSSTDNTSSYRRVFTPPATHSTTSSASLISPASEWSNRSFKNAFDTYVESNSGEYPTSLPSPLPATLKDVLAF